MTFNDNLINPQTDGDIYANACPTIGTLMLAHYSTPAKHNEVIYGADGLFFTTHPYQRLYLRPAFAGEFDPFKGWDEFRNLPTLWVLIAKLGEGTHEITPRYRGECFWKDCESDEQTAALLIEIAERGALNLGQWYSHVSDKRISDRDARKKAN